MYYRNLQAVLISLKRDFSCFLFVFLLFNSITLFSQTKSHIITGYVVDSLSQQPISNTHIIAIDNNIGVITNDNGFFEMIVSSRPINLEFSFVGYYSKRILISTASDTNIIVNLVSKTYEFTEVEISSDNNTYNPQMNKYTVLDYSFIGDSLLILQKRRSIGGTPSLVLLNQNFDTILYKNDLPKGSDKIFKDCLNSHHIITKDSAYQIVLQDNSISFYEPHELHWFYQILNNCLFKKDGDIFFELPIYQGYGHEIIFINEKDKTRTLFIKYVDTESLSSMIKDISHISSYYYLHSVINTSTNDSLTLVHINSFNRSSRYIKDIANQPIKNSICLFKDTIFYFNYYESKIQSYSSLNTPPTEIEINYQNTDGWGSHILMDQVEDKIYSMIKNKAYYQIYLVDTNIGNLEYKSKISIFKGENLKINNGFMYYLSNPHSTINNVKKLSRIKIAD